MNNDLRGYMNKKIKLKRYKIYKDVTKEYFDNSTKFKGNIDYESNSLFMRSNNEKLIAEILFSNFGGDIFLIDERLHNNEGLIPDAIWLENYWEFKNPTTYNAIDLRTKKGIKQIKDNPGGIVLYINNDLDINKSIETVHKRIINSDNLSFELDIIMIFKDRKIVVMNYK